MCTLSPLQTCNNVTICCEYFILIKFIFYLIFKPLQNCDGLRNEYTDNMYEYAPRPTCSATTECGSKYENK